jgi:hypothetical protein
MLGKIIKTLYTLGILGGAYLLLLVFLESFGLGVLVSLFIIAGLLAILHPMYQAQKEQEKRERKYDTRK